MTDIILIQPNPSPQRDLSCLPLGILCISRLLAKEGYKIKIINQIINQKWKEELKEELKKNPICVGLTVIIGSSILNGINTSKFIKEKSDVPIVWGGPHPSIIPRQTIENKYVDIVCEGEGDITFYEIVKTLEKNKPLEKVKGIWFKNNGKIKHTEKRPLADLNELPDIPYNILDLNQYRVTTWYREKRFTFSVETSRGCPFHCTYCYNSNVYSPWRGLTSERVVELLKKLNEDYNAKSFQFQDDNFFLNQKRTNKIMKGILKEKLDITMGFQGLRLDTACKMQKNEFDLLYKAGCRYFNLGLETGSPRILKMIAKGTTIDQAYYFNKFLKKYPDIYPHYNFMTGFPTESTDEMLSTVHMMVKLKKENPNIQIISLFLYAPWPKTEIYNLAIKHGFVPPESLEEWSSIKWDLETNGDIDRFHPWLTKDFIELYNKVQFTIILANNLNINKFSKYFVRVLANLYSPIAKFRFNNECVRFLPEYFSAKLLGKLIRN
jgi:radical SAM superfamily enzyme YgiQ (UPF0313 family)